MGGDYKYIGKPMARRDAEDIVTGAVQYTDDLKFQNLLYGKVLRSPYAHALIKRIDKSKAQALKGVKAVLAWEDIPDFRGGTPRNVRVLDKKVRYVGDAVALVAAVTEEIAEEALDLIEVEYEVLPAVFDIDSALKPGAPAVYDEYPDNILPGGTIIYGENCLKGVVRGDVDKGFAEADVITEGTFGYENIPNALPPESVGAIATFEQPNKVTLWATTQAPYLDKVTLFHVFNRQFEIRTIAPQCGGGFGTKIMCWQVQSYAILLARATRCPVKVMFTKEEHMAAFTLRVGSRIHARVGMKNDGSLTAIQGTWYVDTGYYSFTTQAQVAIGSGELMIMAQCPNWDLKNIVVVTNRNASGSTRGFGGRSEMLFHTASEPCHEQGRSRSFRCAQEELRQARGRLLLARRRVLQLPGGRFLEGHGRRRGKVRVEEEMEGLAHTHDGGWPKAQGHRRRGPRQRRHRRRCGRGIRPARLQCDRNDFSLRD